MDRESIIRMAREAGSIDSEEVIETMYRAFTAAEREELLEEVDKYADYNDALKYAIRARE